MKIFRPLGVDGFEMCHPLAPGGFRAMSELISGPARQSGWTPIPMELIREDDDGSFEDSDSPWLGSHVLIFKRSAMEALSPVLSPHGELLPLACEDAELWVFNPTRVLEALDDANSVVERLPTGEVMRIARYGFRKDVIDGLDAFKLAGLKNGATFVSQRVVDTWTSAGLRGLAFQQVWQEAP